MLKVQKSHQSIQLVFVQVSRMWTKKSVETMNHTSVSPPKKVTREKKDSWLLVANLTFAVSNRAAHLKCGI
jgi:hypothetical protein